MDVAEDRVLEDSKGAVDGEGEEHPWASNAHAIAALLPSQPPARSSLGHPRLQGLLSQHPIKGGSVPVHVYQDPELHSRSGNVP